MNEKFKSNEKFRKFHVLVRCIEDWFEQPVIMFNCLLMFEEIKITVDWFTKKLLCLFMNNCYFISMNVLSSKFIWGSITWKLTIDHDCNLVTQKLSFLGMVSNQDHGRTLNVLYDVQQPSSRNWIHTCSGLIKELYSWWSNKRHCAAEFPLLPPLKCFPFMLEYGAKSNYPVMNLIWNSISSFRTPLMQAMKLRL